MTTAHRPTFVSRKGNNIYTDIPTLQFSVKDLPSETTLKLRFNEQDGRYYNDKDFLKPKNIDEERRKMIKELKKRERDEKKRKLKEEENELLLGIHKKKKISETVTEKIGFEGQKKNNSEEEKLKDEKNREKSENEENEENENEEEEKDSEEELMRELEKIKREQEEETKRKNEEIKEKLEKEMISIKEKSEINDGGSFINSSFDLYNNNNNLSSYSLSKTPEEFSLKKKWYEDTVFRNQSRKEEKIKKRFINDSVHSDFHYRFLDKAIQ